MLRCPLPERLSPAEAYFPLRSLKQNCRRILLLLWIFAAIVLSRAYAQTPARELDLKEYISELHSASNALESVNPAQVREFRRTLASQWVVQANGQRMTVHTGWIAAALLERENLKTPGTGRLRDAQERLTAMSEAAEALSAQTNAPDVEPSRAGIEQILKDKEFQGSAGPSWLDKLKARVREWLSRQFAKLFGKIGIPAAAGNIIAWMLISLAFLLVALWSVRVLLGAASRSEMDLRGAAAGDQDWRYWAAEARSAAERGDYRAAIHAAYWAAVVRLEERRLLTEDRSRTPRESLRLLQRDSAAYASLAQLTRRLELTWYGYRTATSADWNEAMQQLETLGCLPSSTPATAGW